MFLEYSIIRFFDIFFSGIAIIILLPFLIPIAIGLKLTGEHYIFYGQERVGRYGKSFKLLKFATMLKNSPNLPGGLYTKRTGKIHLRYKDIILCQIPFPS